MQCTSVILLPSFGVFENCDELPYAHLDRIVLEFDRAVNAFMLIPRPVLESYMPGVLQSTEEAVTHDETIAPLVGVVAHKPKIFSFMLDLEEISISPYHSCSECLE